jgi:hypothetical protein
VATLAAVVALHRAILVLELRLGFGACFRIVVRIRIV